jgi:hypothetical protein
MQWKEPGGSSLGQPWGETVPVSQVKEVLDHGTRAPATGVTIFVPGSLYPQSDKLKAMREFYRAIRPDA